MGKLGQLTWMWCYLPQAAEYFANVGELGYNFKGPLVNEALVAAGNNLALCEELLGSKLKALQTMKTLNMKVQRNPATSGKPSAQVVLRNISKLYSTPVSVTNELLAMPSAQATIIASPRSTPLQVSLFFQSCIIHDSCMPME